MALPLRFNGSLRRGVGESLGVYAKWDWEATNVIHSSPDRGKRASFL